MSNRTKADRGRGRRLTALARDARKSLRQLRRRHRALCSQQPKIFRKIIAETAKELSPIKPGPKTPPDIIEAATRYAQGERDWKAKLLPLMPGYSPDLPDRVRECAETSWKTRVRKYVRQHPELKKKACSGFKGESAADFQVGICQGKS